jgi:hypothetical protein
MWRKLYRLDPLAIRVTPTMALEPALLAVRTIIEADPDNRGLEIVARLSVFEFKNVPTGTCTFRVARAAGSR